MAQKQTSMYRKSSVVPRIIDIWSGSGKILKFVDFLVDSQANEDQKKLNYNLKTVQLEGFVSPCKWSHTFRRRLH